MQKECVDATNAHRGKTDPCPGKPLYTTLCHLYFMRNTPRLYFLRPICLVCACLKLSLLSGWRLELVPSACSTATTNSTAVMHLHCKTSLTLTPAKRLKKTEVSRVKCGDPITPLLFCSWITPNQLTGHLHSSMTISAEQGTVNTHEHAHTHR